MRTKTYPLSLNKNYVSKWGLTEAVRELIQNAIDSESPFKYSFIESDYDGLVTLRINSEFTTLSPSTLLLGTTSKASRKEAIGSFGEGYKIALLVLTRMSFDVDMMNGDKLWKPSFVYNSLFDCEQLVIEETPLVDKANVGLTFDIHGLESSMVEDIRRISLQMQPALGEVYETSFGTILLERPKELYVGGLFVCETEMAFGYDIKPEFITLERDRQTVSGWDLKSITKQMWFDTRKYDKIAELIESECKDLEYAEFNTIDLVKEACYKLFKSMHPGKVIARNNTEMQDLVKRGLTVYVGGDAFYSNVSQHSGYVRERSTNVVVATPTAILKEWFKNNRSEMRSKAIESFKKTVLDVSDNWRKI